MHADCTFSGNYVITTGNKTIFCIEFIITFIRIHVFKYTSLGIAVEQL